MDRMNGLDTNGKMPSFETGLSRRDVLAAAAAGAAVVAGPPVAAETAPASSFGAPLVELHVPAGVLTVEQRGAMIKGVTEVIVEALGQPPDPAKRLFVEIFETAEGGYGVNGQVFLPRPK
jgi:phenylpyruvate tautomerase PptA (4-oxalocrotonate tautomerase family)